MLTGEDKTLLVRRDALLVLNLRLDVVDSIRRLDLESDGLARQRLDKDLHTATQAEDEVQGRLLLDVVVREGASVLELLAREDQALLIRGDAAGARQKGTIRTISRNSPLLVLDLSLNIVDGVGALDLKSDGLSGQGLHKDLHLVWWICAIRG